MRMAPVQQASRVIPDPRERPFLSPEEALEAFRPPMGRTAWYRAIRAGQVPGARRCGGRWLLATAALLEWAGLSE
jgi:hypothetical protein